MIETQNDVMRKTRDEAQIQVRTHAEAVERAYRERNVDYKLAVIDVVEPLIYSVIRIFTLPRTPERIGSGVSTDILYEMKEKDPS